MNKQSTDASTRRRFLTQAAGVAAGGTALALAAIPPASAAAAPTGLTDASDARLVAAAEGLFAAQAAIDQLYENHDYALGYGEVDERADCQALFAVQKQHVETLITVPATSNAGLQAKASVVTAKFMADGWRPDHKRLAISLANDLVGGARATIPATPALAAPAGRPDPVFGLIGAYRTSRVAYLDALAEHTRLDELGDPKAYLLSEAPCGAFLDALGELIGTAPTTLAGLQAWASCLDEIGPRDGDLLVEAGPTLIATLVESLGNVAVAS